MLSSIINKIKNTRGPINLRTLSQELDIEPSALEAMLNYCAQKGLLACSSNPEESTCCSTDNTAGHCGPNCFGLKACPFIVELPKTYSLVEKPGADE